MKTLKSLITFKKTKRQVQTSGNKTQYNN